MFKRPVGMKTKPLFPGQRDICPRANVLIDRHGRLGDKQLVQDLPACGQVVPFRYAAWVDAAQIETALESGLRDEIDVGLIGIVEFNPV